MDRDHEVFRDDSSAEAVDDIFRRMEGKSLGSPFILILRDFVPHAHLVAVPAAAGVGEVEDFREVRVQIRLALDAEGLVIVLLPDILAVVRRARASVHADAPHRNNLPQRLKVLAEVLIGLVDVPVAGRQRFVMITDFVAQGRDFTDDILIPTLRNGAEIIDAEHPLLRLEAGGPEAVLRFEVHVVTERQGIEIVILESIKQGRIMTNGEIHIKMKTNTMVNSKNEETF